LIKFQKATDIRNCVYGNIRLVETMQTDISEFKRKIEEEEIPRFEKEAKRILQKAERMQIGNQKFNKYLS
jgi:hypothetical protein